MLEGGRTIAFILTQVTLEASSAEDALLVRRRLPHARSAMLESLFDLAGHGRFNGPAVDPPRHDAPSGCARDPALLLSLRWLRPRPLRPCPHR